jgi:hypothetical protein
MTSPRHAEATALGRYYTHPTTGEQLISVTNVLSVGCAKPALVPWAAKIAAEWAMDHLPQLVHRSRTEDRESLRKEISAQVTVARDKAADLGSRIHALAEAHVLGTTLAEEEGDDQAAPYVKQYEAFLRDFNVDITKDIESVELTVANPFLGYAGTLDLLVWLNLDGFIPGMGTRPTDGGKKALWLVDLKTSATRAAASVYGEYALQLAALRHAKEMWLPDDTVIPMVGGIKGAAVLNLRQRTYELVPLPTGQQELDAFKGSLVLAKWMHETGQAVTRGDFRPITAQGSAKPKRARKAASPRANAA